MDLRSSRNFVSSNGRPEGLSQTAWLAGKSLHDASESTSLSHVRFDARWKFTQVPKRRRLRSACRETVRNRSCNSSRKGCEVMSSRNHDVGCTVSAAFLP